MSQAVTIKGGKFTPVVALNPQSVCCDDALLATALLTVGVPEHSHISFAVEQDGDVTRWRWLFAEKSACGTYATAQLVKWWKDAKWHAANPAHEFAIVARILRNHAEVARRIRTAVPRIIVRRGSASVHIPANASAEYRAHMLGILDGSIPASTAFTGPKTLVK